MHERKFLYCAKCGNLVGMIHDAGVAINCCGKAMQEPSLIDVEKNCRVTECDHTALVDTNFPRGEIPQWVYLQTNIGGQRKKTAGFPQVSFKLDDREVPVAAYCYFADCHIGKVEC